MNQPTKVKQPRIYFACGNARWAQSGEHVFVRGKSACDECSRQYAKWLHLCEVVRIVTELPVFAAQADDPR